MPVRLPLFPLDVVLFPGTLVPLHIFEPRYRRMLADVLAGDRRFGLVGQGAGGEARPSTGVIGTTALVRASHPVSGGRSNIVVSGEERFMLRRYLDEGTPYLVGLVDPFEDDEPAEDGEAEAAGLGTLAGRLHAALATLNDDRDAAPAWSDDPGRLSFQIAHLMPVDLDFKRRFLGMRSASDRCRLLLRVVPGIVEDLEGRSEVRRRAARNGAGGQRPDIVVSP